MSAKKWKDEILPKDLKNGVITKEVYEDGIEYYTQRLKDLETF